MLILFLCFSVSSSLFIFSLLFFVHFRLSLSPSLFVLGAQPCPLMKKKKKTWEIKQSAGQVILGVYLCILCCWNAHKREESRKRSLLTALVSLKRNHCCSLTPAMLICTLINAEYHCARLCLQKRLFSVLPSVRRWRRNTYIRSLARSLICSSIKAPRALPVFYLKRLRCVVSRARSVQCVPAIIGRCEIPGYRGETHVETYEWIASRNKHTEDTFARFQLENSNKVKMRELRGLRSIPKRAIKYSRWRERNGKKFSIRRERYAIHSDALEIITKLLIAKDRIVLSSRDKREQPASCHPFR